MIKKKGLFCALFLLLIFPALMFSNVEALDAAANGNIEKIKAYLDGGGDINVKDSGGNTMLMLSAKAGKEDAVKYLISKAADTVITNNSGQSAFEISTNGGFKNIGILIRNEGLKFMTPAVVGDLLLKSLIIILVGMFIVFSFLYILVLTVQLTAFILHKLGLDKDEEEEDLPAPRSSSNKGVVAAIGAAVKKHENK